MLTLTVPCLFFSPAFVGGQGHQAMPLLMLVFPRMTKIILEAMLYKEDGEIPIRMEDDDIHMYAFNQLPFPDSGNFVVVIDGSKYQKSFSIVGETDFDQVIIEHMTEGCLKGPMRIMVAFEKGQESSVSEYILDMNDFDSVASFTWTGRVEIDDYNKLKEVLAGFLG